MDDVTFTVTATQIGTFCDTLNLSIGSQQSRLLAAAVLFASAGLPFGLLIAARRRRTGPWILLVLAFVLCGAVTGCSLPPTDVGLPPCTYHLHVTATGAQTALTHGVDVMLTVNQFPSRP